jgi:glycosyltransferase involved in cell wall biosynthesis
VIIPARNEAALIGRTVDAALAAADALDERLGARGAAEVLVVDNGSADGTAEVAAGRGDRRLRVLGLDRLGSARARNAGAREARGAALVFVDADTLVPRESLWRIHGHCAAGALAGITRLASREGGRRARLWWAFWSYVRRLPLPRAKAMPALMFCTAEAFARYGPFDESVSIGEEWPILARAYGEQPRRFVYDWSLVARSSSRRMELQRLGYTRTLARYGWAILHRSGRVGYPDTVRHASAQHEGERDDDHARCAALGHRVWGGAAAPPQGRDGRPGAIADGG